jgi:hypothetical protein
MRAEDAASGTAPVHRRRSLHRNPRGVMMAAPKRTMTAEHKQALAKGRESARAVKDYLNALEATKPKRGRRVSKEDLEKRLAEVKRQIVLASPLDRLNLAQQRIDLEARIAASGDAGPDIAVLEKAFVKHAKAYSDAKGLSYAAWREVGVPPSVLKAAAITR